MFGIDVVSLIFFISKNGPKFLLNHKVSCFMHFQKRIHQDVKICPKITLFTSIFHIAHCSFHLLLSTFLSLKCVPCFIIYYEFKMFMVFNVQVFNDFFLVKKFLALLSTISWNLSWFLTCKHLNACLFFMAKNIPCSIVYYCLKVFIVFYVKHSLFTFFLVESISCFIIYYWLKVFMASYV